MFWSDFNQRYGSDNSNTGSETVGAMDLGSPGYDGADGRDSPAAAGSGTGGTHAADALVRDAVEFATQATRYDSNGQYKTAIFYYVVS